MNEQTKELFRAYPDSVMQRFDRFYELLVDWNERMNLTGITERNEVFVKHFWDSLLLQEVPEWQERVAERKKLRVCDLGTGAGFPGIPLAICFPEVDFVLMDSLQKRLTFLKEVCQQLELRNVELVHGRAEDLGRQGAHRMAYDFVVSRAVARLNLLLELTAPLCKVGGFLVSYKGPGVEEEVPDGKRAAGKLGVELRRTCRVALPLEYGERVLVIMQQMRDVPKTYPRKAGTPQKNPL